ncbi:GMC family oxidoreductase [Caulobacter sp. UNC279MFTsu5.1]|uniref:GMC family oxidoreductase n=1 Tax=Caulobacter sp. UNC279MFTsu5.1 TaxID=1502775 RepID=UPI000372FACA|nr:GMC family oxidoreductase N-terminal domain-containing protein [Caulobacter sp. UNC279MFTsu5.1]SFI57107.1 5-(hydroxymethyl)furfural/furfural oxidase [Caulobacter sp. UNC279MFTsu5.1]
MSGAAATTPAVQDYDYVILGGGTAGCVLANRLSARSTNRVLLIESGLDTPPEAVPADILDPYPSSYVNPAYRWPIRGHALTLSDSPANPLLHAQVMGGGSSIMGMIMLRGVPADYDGWEAAGARGWGWDAVLPYFRDLENDLDFDGPLHGRAGPTEIRRHRMHDWPPLAKAANQVAERTGAPFIADMNGDFRDGHGALPIAGPTSHRTSSATAYLTREVRARKNLTIVARAQAQALTLDGRKVTGVRVRTLEGDLVARARETIVTMGALLTPDFLLRQGIGDPTQLKAHGVEVRHARTGVGTNLQNHAALVVLAHLRKAGVQRRPQRNHNNTIFRYSSGLPGGVESDMALALSSRASWHAVARRIANFSPLIMAPASRGSVSLPPDGGPAPLVEFNLLGSALDQSRLADGLHRALALVTAPEVACLIGRPVAASRLQNAARFNAVTPMNRMRTHAIATLMDLVPGLGDWVIGNMGAPGGGLAELLSDKDAVADYIRANVTPIAHHSGTCRMGAIEDPLAVVDPQGRVIGLDGLRVADASVMPTTPRGNTNLPVLMIAEKLSAAILEAQA